MPHPFDLELVPLALVDRGINAFSTIDPVGLFTFGFEWQTSHIWNNIDPTVTTTWANCNPVVTTTWVSC